LSNRSGSASYWQTNFDGINAAWTNIGVDLDNIAAQGFKGSNVIEPHVGQFHDHALGYVNYFIPNPPNPYGNSAAINLWLRPYDGTDPNQVLGSNTLQGSYNVVPSFFMELFPPSAQTRSTE
jgi:hypothetical protein